MTTEDPVAHLLACMDACDGDCKRYYEEGLPELQPPPVRPPPPKRVGVATFGAREVAAFDRAPTKWDDQPVGELWYYRQSFYVCVCSEPENSCWRQF